MGKLWLGVRSIAMTVLFPGTVAAPRLLGESLAELAVGKQRLEPIAPRCA
jgi:hypothetical protein